MIDSGICFSAQRSIFRRQFTGKIRGADPDVGECGLHPEERDRNGPLRQERGEQDDPPSFGRSGSPEGPKGPGSRPPGVHDLQRQQAAGG